MPLSLMSSREGPLQPGCLRRTHRLLGMATSGPDAGPRVSPISHQGLAWICSALGPVSYALHLLRSRLIKQQVMVARMAMPVKRALAMPTMRGMNRVSMARA